MSASQFEYWKHTHLTVDVVPGPRQRVLGGGARGRPVPDPLAAVHRRGVRRRWRRPSDSAEPGPAVRRPVSSVTAARASVDEMHGDLRASSELRARCSILESTECRSVMFHEGDRGITCSTGASGENGRRVVGIAGRRSVACSRGVPRRPLRSVARRGRGPQPAAGRRARRLDQRPVVRRPGLAARLADPATGRSSAGRSRSPQAAPARRRPRALVPGPPQGSGPQSQGVQAGDGSLADAVVGVLRRRGDRLPQGEPGSGRRLAASTSPPADAEAWFDFLQVGDQVQVVKAR